MKLFRCSTALLVSLALASSARADDWTGKSVKVKQDGLKLGRKLGGGLVRDGAALSSAKTYTVKSDDGSLVELTGQTGFVFKSDVELTAATATDPAADDKPWAVGTKLLPKKRMETIAFWELDEDGNKETLKLRGTTPVEVRKDAGNGTVRIHDRHREGWVNKADFVTREDAPIYWDRALKANPADTFALYMRGIGWRLKGEPDNAIKDFNECIRLDPANSAAYTARGNAWADKKEHDKAIADYTEAIRLNPKSETTYGNRGNSWKARKEYDKAIADYSEAIRLDPKSVNAFLNRGRTWGERKEHDKAIADYTEAIKLDPKHVNAVYGRGTEWLAKKEYDKAITDYTEAIRLDPKNTNCLNGLAWLLSTGPDQQFRDGKKAVTLAKQLVVLDGSGLARDTLACAYAEAGDFDLAVSEQKMALEDKSLSKENRTEMEKRLERFRAKKPYRNEE